MEGPMSQRVFISYSSVDRQQVAALVKALDDVAVLYFLDQKDIKWGDDITETIGRGLKECAALIVVLSPASIKSQWVPFEIGQAVGLGKRVLPFLTHPSVEIPTFLRRFHYESSIEGVTTYFKSIGLAMEGKGKPTAPTNVAADDEPFDKSAAAAQIMSAVIEGYARRISEEANSEKREVLQREAQEKLSGLGTHYRMPPEISRMYIAFLLDSKSYRPVHEFIETFHDPETIKTLTQEQGEMIVGWLFKQVFDDDSSESESEGSA